jgi:hypothetical protein
LSVGLVLSILVGLAVTLSLLAVLEATLVAHR